jgi:hypothetical protein
MLINRIIRLQNVVEPTTRGTRPQMTLLISTCISMYSHFYIELSTPVAKQPTFQNKAFAPQTPQKPIPSRISEFRSDVVKHFTWSCKESLPFINLFSDIEHAENWELKQP